MSEHENVVGRRLAAFLFGFIGGGIGGVIALGCMPRGWFDGAVDMDTLGNVAIQFFAAAVPFSLIFWVLAPPSDLAALRTRFMKLFRMVNRTMLKNVATMSVEEVIEGRCCRFLHDG